MDKFILTNTNDFNYPYLITLTHIKNNSIIDTLNNLTLPNLANKKIIIDTHLISTDYSKRFLSTVVTYNETINTDMLNYTLVTYNDPLMKLATNIVNDIKLKFFVSFIDKL
jgi:hypothetical protein